MGLRLGVHKKVAIQIYYNKALASDMGMCLWALTQLVLSEKKNWRLSASSWGLIAGPKGCPEGDVRSGDK